MSVRTTFAVAALSAAALGIAACSSEPASSPFGTGQHVYVGTDHNSATMITWTSGSGTHLGGVYTYAQGTGLTGGHLATRSGTVTGTVRGDQVTLTYDSGSTEVGTVHGSDWHLQVQQANGSPEDYVLKPSTVETFNSDVAQLKVQQSSGAVPTSPNGPTPG